MQKQKTFLARVIINMFALMVTAAIVPGIYITGVLAGFVAAFVMGIVNSIVKPIFTILTLPLTILTMGLFLFVVNGFMLLLGAAIVPGFYVNDLGAAIIGSIFITLISWFVNQIVD